MASRTLVQAEGSGDVGLERDVAVVASTERPVLSLCAPSAQARASRRSFCSDGHASESRVVFLFSAASTKRSLTFMTTLVAVYHAAYMPQRPPCPRHARSSREKT